MSTVYLQSELARNLGAPESIESNFDEIFSMTSDWERASLYAAGKYYYSGEGDIFDVGCAAGGSSLCLAAGVKDSDVQTKAKRVHCFDLFRGFSTNYFKTGDRFPTDLELFDYVTRDVKDIVAPYRMDIITFFGRFKPELKVEIAHIDAAKSIALWKVIVERLGRSIIPGKTIWIFQDFERVRLPWQMYGLSYLLPFGQIIGGSKYGTIYFKFDKFIDELTLKKLSTDSFTLQEKIVAIEELFSVLSVGREDLFEIEWANWPVRDLMTGGIAYCYLHGGRRDLAIETFMQTSTEFRSYVDNIGYSAEIRGPQAKG